ncbi:lipid phosphate phosphatase epsilon 2, chloroplastic-like isoform X1 [Salvia splendens]|uniref:lipid phosphate phosphatase epsilon 2, chloroplastic-like isoform X1 n=2 Tax=Salvia splendens TaxID=180675 RepID=UPI001C27D5AC|nr:lipid phosphate phosphatase epsilon 2, chloroplastic-like isoform X1 [Salvia splendens]
MSAIFTPISATSFSVSELGNSREPAKCFSERLSFSGESICRNPVSWDIRRRNLCKMMGLKWGRASTTDDGVPAFEQEAFVDVSLTFQDGGIEATVNHLSKWLISATFIVFVLWRHDALALWASLGSALNALLSVVLKHSLNQERPFSTSRSDPGMPSSHAQAIAYTIIFLAVTLVEMLGVNAFTVTFSGVFAVIGSYFAWLRVSQRLHTVSQVVVGAVVGFTFGFLWFWSWNSFVLSLFTSFLWARIAITLGAVVFVACFLLHSYRSQLN